MPLMPGTQEVAVDQKGGPLPVHRAPLSEWGAVDLGLREAALAAGAAVTGSFRLKSPPIFTIAALS